MPQVASIVVTVDEDIVYACALAHMPDETLADLLGSIAQELQQEVRTKDLIDEAAYRLKKGIRLCSSPQNPSPSLSSSLPLESLSCCSSSLPPGKSKNSPAQNRPVTKTQ